MADPNSALHQQSQSILTEKVARALTVRTETPAMKAALDALSHLHTTETSSSDSGGAAESKAKKSSSSSKTANNKSFAFAIDSRSVRVAIEQDALQQALLLQTELRSLVDTVQNLRQGVSEVAEIAQRVREATMMQVITSETPTPMLAPDSHLVDAAAAAAAAAGGVTSAGDHPGDPPRTPPSSAVSVKTDAAGSLEEEQKLANVLSDAFLHRDRCRRRLEAVHAFLERFDLSQEDSRLLDHYAFEDVAVGGNNNEAGPFATAETNTVVNGLAFLNALERVRNIRLALSDSFGNAGDMAFLQQGSSSADHHDYDRKGMGASSALRMLESLAQKQERAYERLYHWLQQYLQLFSATSTPNNNNNNSSVDNDGLDEALQHPFVRRSLYTLRHVPAFYTHTLELIASSRRAEETRRFLLALTSGYSGFPPIEMKAHDPVVYVGDMLAFSFKAFSTEADLAKGLLQYTPEDEDGEGHHDEDNAQAEEEKTAQTSSNVASDSSSSSLVDKPITAKDMVAMSMSGLARPLKSRILQVVSSLSRRPDEEDAESDDGLNDDFEEEGAGMRARITHLYEISGLLLFYKSVIEKSINKLDGSRDQKQGGREEQAGTSEEGQPQEPSVQPSQDINPLIACLLDCLRETTTAYEATTRAYGAMLSQISSITGETEALQAKSMLALVADVRLNSPGYSIDVECPEECRTILSIEWVSAILVDAALYCCVTLDDVLALKHAINDIQKAGLSVVASAKLNESIDGKERKLVAEIIEKEKVKVLELCGLGDFCTAWRGWQHIKGDGKLMVSYPGLSREAAEAAMKSFYASLFSPPLPSLEHAVRDPQLRKQARSEIAAYVCSVYSDLHASIVSSSEGGYQDLSFLAHTPDQVKTLFSA